MKNPSTAMRSVIAPALFFILLSSWQELSLATSNPPGTVLYSGRATVLRVSAKVLTANLKLVLADTGELDPNGTTKDATVLTFKSPLPLAVNSQTAHAIASGVGTVSAATAAVEKLDVTIGLLRITADVIEANSFAECNQQWATVAVKGLSTIANLKVNGLPIVISQLPNQTINLPGLAKLVINEQTKPDVNSILVNAVHITVPGLLGAVATDIVISHAESGILTCAQL